VLIKRYGYAIETDRIRNGTCPDCGTAIAGVGL
jgi:pyruvate formate lyase activating enzyme